MTADGLHVPPPVFRALRVFAVDPGMDSELGARVANETVFEVPWEDLSPGPRGEYLEIVDDDEHGRRRYDRLDLDDPALLAQSGLAPSDGNPQFRYQMTYAVGMDLIHDVEAALGRRVHWRPHRGRGSSGSRYRRRLAMRPHSFVGLEATYERDAGACFGYDRGADGSPFESSVVFTSHSRDCITFTLAWAVLDGMGLDYRLSPFGDPEVTYAFGDIVALFQHFADGEALREQIRAVRGDIDARTPLGVVAPQLGLALNRPDGLRDALGWTDDQGRWHPWTPDPGSLRDADRTIKFAASSVLVRALFDGFKRIYRARVADLFRIASQGTGVLPPGHLHPDLVARLSAEAAHSAWVMQQMCIRALDYLPPTGTGFPDVVRALVTADVDLFPEDDQRYRLMVVDALRGYGILPERMTLSPETLVWSPPPDADAGAAVAAYVRELSQTTSFWSLPTDRAELWRLRERWRRGLAARLRRSGDPLGPVDVRKRFSVRTFDLRQRTGTAGSLTLDWVVTVVQGGIRDRVGVTMLVDAQSGEVRYFIPRPDPTQDASDLLARADTSHPRPPSRRRLRVYAVDPSLGTRMATAAINEVTVTVPWERAPDGRPLSPGPAGEYVEVIDHDPASRCFYAPVDLNDPRIVSQDGLTPSESNPQFHQQMVYAVTMRVIEHFERALGRRALWSPRLVKATRPAGAPSSAWLYAAGSGVAGEVEEIETYVPRLRLHPHALREANAYYSPDKKALLFGYFPSQQGDASRGLTVFTCVSHDIVAHEVTHALLDGIHRHFNEPTNADVLAFHEAFADLVALFEHFSLPGALREQIVATRGDLAAQNMLGELAQQFGQAIGKRGALRSAIGSVDPETGRWTPAAPDPTAYRRLTEPHERGAILVAAVFDAFLTIYKAAIADLLRIATAGTGILPEGAVHPDLVGRLAQTAADSAQKVLRMCIRALDYCPPVDITFGDYLRAIVTADQDSDPVDADHDRVAFVEAFRRYGIVPDNIRSLSVDGLLWRPSSAAPDEDEDVVVSIVSRWAVDIDSWHLTHDRRELFELMCRHRDALHAHLLKRASGAPPVLGGLDLRQQFEVHSVRPSVGSDWLGRPQLTWVVELVQSVPAYFDAAQPPDAPADFTFRGGCTLLIDGRTGQIRYSIKKPLDEARLRRQRDYLLGVGVQSLAATYFGGPEQNALEPFAMLHRE